MRAMGDNHGTKEQAYGLMGCGSGASDADPGRQLEDFINAQAAGGRLDPRTVRAYRMDMEHFYAWLGEAPGPDAPPGGVRWEDEMEAYLDHLFTERGLSPATVTRKYRVLGYYLSYLVERGVIPGCRPIRPACQPSAQRPGGGMMSKDEVDAFFRALEREYAGLGSDFRRRICLRDQVMMKLLFYHGIEVSQLLRLEVSDYDRGTAALTVRRGNRGDRVIPLLSYRLCGQMVQWLSEREYFEQGEEIQTRMFLSRAGRPLSMKMVIKIFDKYRVLAGIRRGYTPKDLKRSMGRYAREAVEGQCRQAEVPG